MNSYDYTIKRGDTKPNLQATLKRDGNAVDLSAASGVKIYMKKAGKSTLKLDASVTITDAENGVVEHDWANGGSEDAGVFQIEFEVDWNGEPETFPHNEYKFIEIIEDLG